MIQTGTKTLTLLLLLAALFSSPAGAEERFGVRSIVDGSLSRMELPPGSGRDADVRVGGQVVLLASYQIRSNLFVLYEGRISQSSSLTEGALFPSVTRTTGVVQGYLRYTTKLPSGLNIQIGKFGHPFGQFLTRNYADQNPLISFPLMYTHRTAIRANQIPWGPYDFVHGQEGSSPTGGYGNSSAGSLPLINYSYTTGVMGFGNFGRVDYRIALVNSSLARPLNLGTPGQHPSWVAGAGINPLHRLRLGTSFTSGPYLDASVRSYLPSGTHWSDFTQRALGFDLQLFFQHLDIQGELIFANFKVPNIRQRLGSTGYFVEFKRTLTPRLFTAARWNQLYFDRFRGGYYEDNVIRFDRNVQSLELGLGFRLTEKLLAKTSYQFNHTSVSTDPNNDLFSIQLVYSFDVRKLIQASYR